MDSRPNVVMIVIDQMRRSALGVNGHACAAHTPHLDQLAREGINFTRAYSACPSCIAARATMWTGMEPINHGFTGYDSRPEWHYSVTLPGVLANSGYHTQCVGKMHVEPARNLIGFHHVVLHDGFLHDKRRQYRNAADYDDYLPWLRERLGPAADICDVGPGCNGYASRCWPWDERWHPTSWVTSESINFLRRRDPTKPFFLKVSYHRPHSPLDPPQTYFDMYADVDFPEPLRGDWVEHELPHGQAENPVPTGRPFRERARKAYHALISQIDYELNRLFIELSDRNVWDETLIMVVADHGDMLYDHNLVRKSVPFEGSSGVPLIVRLPKSMRQGRVGVTDARLAELRDLFPTVCEVCGITPPAQLDGQSLLAATRRQEPIHGEHPNAEWSNHWLCDGHEKYCWFSQNGRELLFNLDDDPDECHDLSKEQPARLAEWRRRLIAKLSDRAEGYVANGELQTGRRPMSSQAWAGAGKNAAQ